MWRPASSISHCGVQCPLSIIVAFNASVSNCGVQRPVSIIVAFNASVSRCGVQRQSLWRPASAIVASSASQCGVRRQSLWRLTAVIVASNVSHCGVQRQSLWRPTSVIVASCVTSQRPYITTCREKGVSRKSNLDPSDCQPSAALPLGQTVSFNYNLSG